MDNAGLKSPRSQVRHEVGIRKVSDCDCFSHMRGARVRKVLRFYRIQVDPFPSSRLKITIRGNLCIELDGGGGVIIWVEI